MIIITIKLPSDFFNPIPRRGGWARTTSGVLLAKLIKTDLVTYWPNVFELKFICYGCIKKKLSLYQLSCSKNDLAKDPSIVC